MNTKVEIILGILIAVIAFETWILAKSWKIDDNIIPSNSLIYTDLAGTNFSDTLVTIEGSWYSEAKLAYPVQSSHIECWKDKGICVEAQGTIKDGYLNTTSYVYDIASWNEKEVIAKTEALCKKTELKIDRGQKQATLNATTTKTTDECIGISKEPMLLYLMNGYDAWSKNKQK
jgi:hypothetical protein